MTTDPGQATVRQYAPALEGFRGELTRPGEPGYDAARAVHNGMIDKRPALVARCADVSDVRSALRHGREQGLAIAVRGGGHSGPGFGTVDDGVVIDLSAMNGVRVDPARQTVRVEGGATLGSVDHATHSFGLAVPAGITSTTGVGGLVLGGGIGHLTRSCGLSIDNLLEADVVLADGRLVRASADDNPDLFWAIRGGGGNFGIVTSFLFRAQPVSTVVAGPTLFHNDRAAEVMRAYREFLPRADRRLNGFFAFLIVPPVDPFPEELRMMPMNGVVWCFNGTPADADAALAPFRELGPALDGVAEMPLPMLQSAFDGLFPKGIQQYWRGDFVDELTDEAIERYVEHGTTVPTVSSTMHLYPIDGAAHDVASDATAWGARQSRWSEVIVAAAPEPERAGELRDWVIGFFDAVHPYAATGGGYVNFMMDDESPARVQATYGPNYERLRQVKAKYDPDNVFHVNQNIVPTGRTAAVTG
jgi:FAD/FMN-containing dehydrogenase